MFERGAALNDPTAVAPEVAPLPALGEDAERPAVALFRWDRLSGRWRVFFHRVRTDYESFYSWSSLRNLLAGVAVAAALANTSVDQDFRDWYQHRVHTRDLGRFAAAWKTFGEGDIFIPAYAGLAVLGAMYEDTPTGGLLAEFAGRTTRAYLVGLPPLAAGQWLIGASRPGEQLHGSHWRPFQDDNGISGHAFVGAVPFLTAANLTDNAWVKSGFYCLSALTGWSRIDSDKHYLSQVLFGWWLAYLACSAVDRTAGVETPYAVLPFVAPETVGMSVVCRL